MIKYIGSFIVGFILGCMVNIKTDRVEVKRDEYIDFNYKIDSLNAKVDSIKKHYE